MFKGGAYNTLLANGFKHRLKHSGDMRWEI